MSAKRIFDASSGTLVGLNRGTIPKRELPENLDGM